MAQIIDITSEALQSTIRRLLPSQRGFGEDLQASNVIQPIIDLTPSAEGSEIPAYLQQALNLTDVTAFSVANTTTSVVSTPGFYRIFGSMSFELDASTTAEGRITVTDGTTTKNMYSAKMALVASDVSTALNYDFVVILQAGETLQAISNLPAVFVNGVARQIADTSGNLINPTGFVPQ